MSTSAAAVALAVATGAIAGWMAGPLSTGLGLRRYGPGTPGYDPDDLALAPLRSAPRGRARGTIALALAAVLGLLTATAASGEAALVLSATALLVGLACLVDLQFLRLPDPLTYGAAVTALALIWAVSGRLDADAAIRGAVAGGLVYAGFLLGVAELFHLVRGTQGMGLGDVKLALPLGITAGWVGYSADLGVLGALSTVVLAIVVANVAGVALGLALTRLRPRQHFPFGPAMAAGWLVAVALAH